MQFNSFLLSDGTIQKKGGGRFVEDAAHVENIVVQTRGGPLDPFEDRLAGEIMDAFGQGHFALDQLVAALNDAGSVDAMGQAWTEAAFQDQMALSASLLFAGSQPEHAA